jgi:hypothetical protein
MEAHLFSGVQNCLLNIFICYILYLIMINGLYSVVKQTKSEYLQRTGVGVGGGGKVDETIVVTESPEICVSGLLAQVSFKHWKIYKKRRMCIFKLLMSIVLSLNSRLVCFNRTPVLPVLLPFNPSAFSSFFLDSFHVFS